MKSLIIYATKYGSAAEVARRIKNQLDGNTELINVITDPAPTPNHYDTVILGGSIYMGKIQKQLTNYINKNLEELKKKNVGLYICAGHPDKDYVLNEFRNAFPEDLYKHALVKDTLGYVFNFEKLRFFDKLILRAFKGDSVSTSELYDDRIASFSQAFNK
ncbi:flavodoxin domain-containing protein [Sporolactobacillus laevolacticus]|uniref:flavodoxin domain-containing protein n=1 Tax=Sporolactobacillus laevolacticus TaxID=33018 RepID=UPI0025B5554D|nr:flavodoxin domain-containing protein [Sporolactobacillus laevolacticus]MDN3956354.1 flavodoxin domain-containing protein [Sporolactobacillus laevolacticus]